MPRALYQVLFSNFSNVIHFIENFGNQGKMKWTNQKDSKKKIKGKEENKKEKGTKRKI